MTTETVEYWRKMILKLKKKDQDLKTRHRIVNHLQIVIISYKKLSLSIARTQGDCNRMVPVVVSF